MVGPSNGHVKRFAAPWSQTVSGPAGGDRALCACATARRIDVPNVTRPRRTGTHLARVAVLGVTLSACTGSEAPVVTRAGDVPSPLFGEVEQLVPDSLPDGWGRCGGARSTAPGATSEWWSQTFGPMSEGTCQSVVTVTQLPPRDSFNRPVNAEDGKLPGDADVSRWSDQAAGSFGLFTWAFDQNLLVEACCGDDAAQHFEAVAAAALNGTRERAPAGCDRPESDLDAETLIENLTGKSGRMTGSDGCPVRIDIARMETLPDEHHCWPGVTFLTVGTPVSASRHDTGERVFVRDPDGRLTGGVPNPLLDLDATLPPTAVDTGFSQDGRSLWIDEADASTVFVVDATTVESWPHDVATYGCG